MIPEYLISSYTRAQAIADGVLIDVSTTARELGFIVPVAVTNTVWAGYLAPRETDVAFGQDIEDRLWDVLGALRAVIKPQLNVDERLKNPLSFRVALLFDGQRRPVELHAEVEEGDGGDLVITILKPGEFD